jgi:hypothetical protein
MSGKVTMDKIPNSPGFATMTKDEKTRALVEAYEESGADFIELAGKLALAGKFCREIGMSPAQTWATLVTSNAETLDLDLDNPNGMAVAATLAYYQM